MRYWLPLMVLALPAAALGQPVQHAIRPGQDVVAIRTYGFGLLPLDGRFSRFSGVLQYDPIDHAHCSVALHIEAASLDMMPATVAAMIRGPDFLDVARYPTLVYRGSCTTAGVQGQLSMHGVTRPFALTLAWGTAQLTATGSLQRAEWGMTQRSLLGGRTVRITVRLPLVPTATPER